MKTINWLPLYGYVKYDNNQIHYLPNTNENNQQINTQIQYAQIKCSSYFEKGIIEFSIKVEHLNQNIFVILNHGETFQYFIGISPEGYFAIQMFNGAITTNLANTQVGSITKGEYKVKIEVIGSNIILFVNDIEVCKANCLINNCQPVLSFQGNNSSTIKDFKITSKKQTAFVIMQFTSEFDILYNEVIKPTIESYNIECIRGDDIYSNGLILNDIERYIQESFFIVADITPNNPNVFYEVGYAHAIRKPLILLCDNDKRENLPFDISGFRTIMYSDSIGGRSKIEQLLKKHLEHIVN
jgi:predicted nucleotide-binding protein